jgi:hypothetical protein
MRFPGFGSHFLLACFMKRHCHREGYECNFIDLPLTEYKCHWSDIFYQKKIV